MAPFVAKVVHQFGRLSNRAGQLPQTATTADFETGLELFVLEERSGRVAAQN